MKIRYQSISNFLKIVISLFGAWSLYAQLAVLFHIDFATLKSFSFLPVLGTIALLIYKNSEYDRRPGTSSYSLKQKTYPFPRIPHWFWLVIPFILAAFYQFIGLEWIFWLLSMIYLFAASHALPTESPTGPKSDQKINVGELMVLICICGVVILITLGVNRPDADDAFFVSLASAAIDNPEESLYGFDNLYRSGLPLVEQHLHLVQTYEYFIAVLADLTKIPVRYLYYVALPPFWATIGILTHWIVLRRFLPARPTLVGLAGLVVLLFLWGDGHRTYGNFAFVRMFQGKAIYLLVALPMIFLSALEYRNMPNRKNWLFLMLHQFAAMGFTTNGLVVAPVASALVLLSGLQFSRTFWLRSAKGLAASLPLIPVGICMMYNIHQYHASEHILSLSLGYQTVLGSNRTGFVLLGLLMLPSLSGMAKLRESTWLSSYVFLSSVMLLCPALLKFVGLHVNPLFSWRIFWCWPVPLLLALTIGTVTCKSLPHSWFNKSLLGIVLTAFALAGPSAVTQTNWAWTNIGTFKVSPGYKVAYRLMTLSKGNGLALVPQEIAVDLCGFQNAPRLIAVRELYLNKLRGLIPEQDWITRFRLFSYIGGKTNDLKAGLIIDEIDKRGITTVAFRSKHPHAKFLANSLSRTSFQDNPLCWLRVGSEADSRKVKH